MTRAERHTLGKNATALLKKKIEIYLLIREKVHKQPVQGCFSRKFTSQQNKTNYCARLYMYFYMYGVMAGSQKPKTNSRAYIRKYPQNWIKMGLFR